MALAVSRFQAAAAAAAAATAVEARAAAVTGVGTATLPSLDAVTSTSSTSIFPPPGRARQQHWQDLQQGQQSWAAALAGRGGQQREAEAAQRSASRSTAGDENISHAPIAGGPAPTCSTADFPMPRPIHFFQCRQRRWHRAMAFEDCRSTVLHASPTADRSSLTADRSRLVRHHRAASARLSPSFFSSFE